MTSQIDLPNGRAAVYHDNSCHGEDVYISLEPNHFTVLDAVFDGATGRGGAHASAYAAELLRGATVESVETLTTALEAANQQLFQRGRGRFFLTTASVTLKLGSLLHVVSVGDSPIFLIREGETMPLTPTASGHTFQGVATVLGHRERLSYRATSISLQVGDRLVVASDGLIENVSPREISALIAPCTSPEAAVSAMRQLLCEKKRTNKGGVDNSGGFRNDDTTAIIRYFEPTRC